MAEKNPLAKKGDLHKEVLDYIRDRIKLSERKMSQFYSRWAANEMRMQAYIHLRDYQRILKEQNDRKGEPGLVDVIVPHTYATASTAVTFWLNVFAGRDPMFQVESNSPERVGNTESMETKLHYDANHTRLVKWLYGFLSDAATYGVGILRTSFLTSSAMRTVLKPAPPQEGSWGKMGGSTPFKAREKRIVYQGSMVESIDPFMFFPDPRVPMAEVNRKGEWVFWRSYVGLHTLKKGQAQGWYFQVDEIDPKLPRREMGGYDSESNRSLLSRGDPHPGSDQDWVGEEDNQISKFVQIDEGTIEIVPSELKIEKLYPDLEPDVPCKFLMTIANLDTIIRCEPFVNDHDMHPVAVTEPHTFGYGFGQPGLVDLITPYQDVMGWLLNSHMKNVQNAVNNMFLVDPAMIEMQDLKARPKGGRVIRLKKAAYGQDLRQAFQQLTVTDVTRNHMSDMQVIKNLADNMSGVDDNQRGIQDSGARKTATEVRIGADAGSSRLASSARLISAQGVTDLTEQMTLDNLQFLETEFQTMILGADGIEKPVTLGPNEIAGDYFYPVHDGTLPVDKAAMFELWNQLFQLLMSPPAMQGGLPQMYDVPKIFDWIARLGGAKNIGQFRVGVVDPATAAMQAQAGNIVPANGMQLPPPAAGGQPTGYTGPPSGGNVTDPTLSNSLPNQGLPV